MITIMDGNTDIYKPNITPPDQRPYNAGILYTLFDWFEPKNRGIVENFELMQRTYDNSEGQDKEAQQELEKLARSIVHVIKNAPIPDDR